ncbi:hypothetical protein TVAG_424330 [Trichomonas vaginalis G3]|uniref:Uncharacterized protein n=1 Tax=Trichomonas vaginalis (strain ATCC PRA-98 / G3) TaxID=412133 RepID=A2E1S2_TRIV3|nr:hypothetical protein TVAGG3_0304400 [Trichomonas vaginalis G3]EAY13401.1 hypothetical protein TVAG_424330 [Trichomonas vaginalis G3]KAI5528153.1 hypothetical protein TVAGG3_0304400 [Trichomonas vaginalis G3]|eukprot:XP_001325624.1 hypothetical protein [Trichomonas vaginalis G3]
MGCMQSFCTFRKNLFDEQYEMLMASKPAPISLETIPLDPEDSDPPLFAIAKSDSDVVSDPENLTDEELNLYADQLSKNRNRV